MSEALFNAAGASTAWQQQEVIKAGPVTAARQRRAALLWCALCGLGVLPAVFAASGKLQAFGLGLWFPGAGFIATGQWWGLPLTLLTMVLFGVAFFAWFGSGNILAPIIVWAGAAFMAAWAAGQAGWAPAAPIVCGATIAGVALGVARNRAKAARQNEQYREKVAARPNALAALAAAAQPEMADDRRELDEDQLSSIRYLLDRALQPIGRFDGYNLIDIFQTAALRYQLNYVGYALSTLQARWTPSFHGYLSLAQRNLIETYLTPKVWSYWRLESAWGHLNFTNHDPAARDNVMLTGYYAGQVAQYQGNTGDDRYSQPGALTFTRGKTVYPHDLPGIVGSVLDNMRGNPYCLYPCEPNWIYPGCNLRAMSSLAAVDRAFGTSHVAEVLPRFAAQLDTEFTDRAGSIVALRSEITGFALPFPMEDFMVCGMLATILPERARAAWALKRQSLAKELRVRDGRQILNLNGKGIDFGNYRKDDLLAMSATIMQAAREFGDSEIAEAAANTFELCDPVRAGGVTSYRGSNFANIYAAWAKFSERGDIRAANVAPVAEASRTGPILDEISYPDVLVARAFSNGTDLDLVLAPGGLPGERPIALARLKPGRHYRVADRPGAEFRADGQGRANLMVEVRGRTKLHIQPAA